jgi:hypothetical protein
MFLDGTGANGGLGQGGDQEGGRRPGYGVFASIILQRHRLAASTAASPTKKNIAKLLIYSTETFHALYSCILKQNG